MNDEDRHVKAAERQLYLKALQVIFENADRKDNNVIPFFRSDQSASVPSLKEQKILQPQERTAVGLKSLVSTCKLLGAKGLRQLCQEIDQDD